MPYALLLTDEYDQYATLHTFETDELWHWLQKPETFPPGVSSIISQMPTSDGQPVEVRVTIGSPTNDKAHALAGDAPGIESHPMLELDEYGAKLEELHETIGADNVYEGLWY